MSIKVDLSKLVLYAPINPTASSQQQPSSGDNSGGDPSGGQAGSPPPGGAPQSGDAGDSGGMPGAAGQPSGGSSGSSPSGGEPGSGSGEGFGDVEGFDKQKGSGSSGGGAAPSGDRDTRRRPGDELNPGGPPSGSSGGGVSSDVADLDRQNGGAGGGTDPGDTGGDPGGPTSSSPGGDTGGKPGASGGDTGFPMPGDSGSPTSGDTGTAGGGSKPEPGSSPSGGGGGSVDDPAFPDLKPGELPEPWKKDDTLGSGGGDSPGGGTSSGSGQPSPGSPSGGSSGSSPSGGDTGGQPSPGSSGDTSGGSTGGGTGTGSKDQPTPGSSTGGPSTSGSGDTGSGEAPGDKPGGTEGVPGKLSPEDGKKKLDDLKKEFDKNKGSWSDDEKKDWEKRVDDTVDKMSGNTPASARDDAKKEIKKELEKPGGNADPVVDYFVPPQPPNLHPPTPPEPPKGGDFPGEPPKGPEPTPGTPEPPKGGDVPVPGEPPPGDTPPSILDKLKDNLKKAHEQHKKELTGENQDDTAKAYEDEQDNTVVKDDNGPTKQDLENVAREGDRKMTTDERKKFIEDAEASQQSFDNLQNSKSSIGEVDPNQVASILGTKRAKLQGNVLQIFQRLIEQALTIEEETDQNAPSRKVEGLTGSPREVTKVGTLGYLLDASASINVAMFKQALKAIDYYVKQYFTNVEGAYVTIWGGNAVTKKVTSTKYNTIASVYTKAQQKVPGMTGSTHLLAGWKSMLTMSQAAMNVDVCFVFSDFELHDTELPILKKICRRLGKRIIYIAIKHQSPSCPIMDKADPSWRKRMVFLAPLAQQSSAAGIK